VGADIELDVRDHGPSIPADARERTMEPFLSPPGADGEENERGLGLALVHRSVAAVGGRVIIEDIPEGGTRVLVRLPATRRGVLDEQSWKHLTGG
jgi:signal transduction histidine kinase